MGGRIKLRDINQDPAIRQEASGGSDILPGFTGGSHGAVAYRGASKWEILGPGTTGYSLTTNGPGANPTWELVVVNIVGRATGQGATIVSSFSTAIT